MLRDVFTWFLLAALAVVLAACCGDVSCDRCLNDGKDDDFHFQFDTTTTSGFTPAQLRQITVKRITRAYKTAPLTAGGDSIPVPARRDSVVITRTAAQLGDVLIIGNNYPFTATAGRKVDFDKYIYLISVRRLATPTDTTTIRYRFANVRIQGGFEDVSGCCTCYRNTAKTGVIDREPFDFTDDSPLNDAPKSYLIRRKP